MKEGVGRYQARGVAEVQPVLSAHAGQRPAHELRGRSIAMGLIGPIAIRPRQFDALVVPARLKSLAPRLQLIGRRGPAVSAVAKKGLSSRRRRMLADPCQWRSRRPTAFYMFCPLAGPSEGSRIASFSGQRGLGFGSVEQSDWQTGGLVARGTLPTLEIGRGVACAGVHRADLCETTTRSCVRS